MTHIVHCTNTQHRAIHKLRDTLLLGDKMRRCLRVRPILFSVHRHNHGLGPDVVLAAAEHRSWTPDGPVKLRLSDTGAQSFTPISVPTLFR